MSKEAWRAKLFKEHAAFVAGVQLSKESPTIDAIAMDAFDTGYDFFQKHNDNGNAVRTGAFSEDAVLALRDMMEAGMLAFINDKTAS